LDDAVGTFDALVAVATLFRSTKAVVVCGGRVESESFRTSTLFSVVDLKANGVLVDVIRHEDGTKAKDDGAAVRANRTAAEENLILLQEGGFFFWND
jgi:hypothetical protein